MAHTQSSPRGIMTDPSLDKVYNVDFAVGPGKPNNKDDVQLVQLFLQQIYSHSTLGAGPLPDGKKIDTDGVCGPITKSAIWHLQTYLQRVSGGQVYADGVVSPVPLGDELGPHMPSLIWMNWLLQEAIGRGRFITLQIDSITPSPLRTSLPRSYYWY